MSRPSPITKADQTHLSNWSKFDLIQTVVIGVDAVATEMEHTWGVGRLVTLVGNDTRLRFKKGIGLWRKAITESDLEAVRDLGPKMIAAWRFMSKEADALGHAPLSPNVFEAKMADGRVLVVVRTVAEVHAVARQGRGCLIFAMDELARLVPQLDLVNAIKTEFEGATVERVTVRDEGFASAWAEQSWTADLYEENV